MLDMKILSGNGYYGIEFGTRKRLYTNTLITKRQASIRPRPQQFTYYTDKASVNMLS